jgi:SAM-dependent methyltransferase
MAGTYRPCVHVFPLYGTMVVTDLRDRAEADQVFSLMLEQVYIVRNLGVRRGNHVLELCLGSGVNCLLASKLAARVVGVDVSPRALAFARFNAALNPGAVPIETALGSLYDALPAGDRFDLVVVNPPFEPVPPGAAHYLHSHGGEDGLDVVRACVAGAPQRLRPGGRFEMFTWSPGSEASSVVEDVVRAAFPSHRVEVHLVDHAPLDERIATFRGAPGYEAWRGRLRRAGFTRIWGVFVRAAPDGVAGVVRIEPDDEVRACRDVVAEWT